jgi:hypothetical protein
MAKLKTVENWERDLNINLIKRLRTDRKKVEVLKCSVCVELSTRVCLIAGFSQAWVDGTTSVKLDSLRKHVQGRVHQHAEHLFDQKTLGELFATAVVKQSLIGRGLLKMAEIDKKVMLTRFNTAYYLATSERPYSDTKDIITRNEMNGIIRSPKFRNERVMATLTDSIADNLKEKLIADLKKTRYFSLLTDGSTDKGVSEQEALYLLFISNECNQSNLIEKIQYLTSDLYSLL